MRQSKLVGSVVALAVTTMAVFGMSDAAWSDESPPSDSMVFELPGMPAGEGDDGATYSNVVADGDGNVWVAGDADTSILFHVTPVGEVLQTIDMPSNFPLDKIALTPDGEIWSVGEIEGETALLAVNGDEDFTVEFTGAAGRPYGMKIWNGHAWWMTASNTTPPTRTLYRYDPVEGLGATPIPGSGSVNFAINEETGAFWIQDSEHSIASIDPYTADFESFEVPISHPIGLIEAQASNVWVAFSWDEQPDEAASRSQVWRLDSPDANGKWSRVADYDGLDTVSAMAADPMGTLWIGGYPNLDAYFPDGTAYYPTSYGIDSRPISIAFAGDRVVASGGRYPRSFDTSVGSFNWVKGPTITAGCPDGAQTVATQISPVISTGTGSAPLEFSVEGDLPPGLSFDADRYEFTGTPERAGDYQFDLVATMPYFGITPTAKLNCRVTVAPQPSAPILGADSLPDATVGEQYEARIQLTGTRPITLATDELPSGLEVSVEDENVLLRGTPDQDGKYQVTLTATNALGSDVHTFALTVSAVSSPTPSPGISAGTGSSSSAGGDTSSSGLATTGAGYALLTAVVAVLLLVGGGMALGVRRVRKRRTS